MQPPPRKGNYSKFLKNLHGEQIAKLLAKNQHENDLLEDIRSFILKRSAIEKSYSEALLKISSAYLNKKFPNIPDIKLDGGDEKWNMWNIWRTVLEENEKLARARLAAVEVFQQQIADDAKFLRSHKIQTARKCVDQLSLVQKELQVCVQDVDKAKKMYFDEEHSAHDVRDKARDIEEKLKKKKGSFFQSITSLQKNSARVSTKRDQLEEKSSGARNDYLLCLAAANAHQNRYFLIDLQLAMSTMESNVYDKVAEYLTLMGRTELLTCSAMQTSYTKIRDQAKQLTREYNLQCVYLYYPVLKQHIQYEFEPCDNDPIDHITAEHETSAATLSKEARRWATRIARENSNIRDCVRKLQIYNALRESGQKVDPNDQNGPDLETKIEEMKQNIRRSETSKMKAESRLEYLRKGGVNVDEWLQEAETLNVQDIPRSASSLSVHTDASGMGDHPSSDSFYDSDYADGEATLPRTEKSDRVAEDHSQEQYDSHEVDAILEQERQRIEQLTAGWEDPTQVDWGEEPEHADGITDGNRQSGLVYKCTALYSYTAQNPDELTIIENEQLEVVGEGDGDGWLKARNYRGEEGYVPHNYLDVDRDHSVQTSGLANQISFSSVDYTVDEEEVPQQKEEVIPPPKQDPPPVTSIPNKIPEKAMYCCALYDYEGEGDELTFEEGQVIRILSKCAHSVDDGWWKGELEGRVGNFPSLVVEECDEFGEPITNQWDETPPCSAPPVFSPPDAPDHIIDSFQGAEEESDAAQEADGPSSDTKTPNSGFAMALSRNQQEQYGTQFDARNSVPTIDIPSVVVADENGETMDEQEGEDCDEFGLEVAQIVITAATPMIEEPEHPFPPAEDKSDSSKMPEEEEKHPETEKSEDEEVSKDESADSMETKPECSQVRPNEADNNSVNEEASADFCRFTVSSSTGSEGETTGPSTAENSVSNAPPYQDVTEPKQVIGGRASIPDELEPHQLARLQDLKESNA